MKEIVSLGAVLRGDTDCDIIMFYADEPDKKPSRMYFADDEDYPTQELINWLRVRGYNCALI